MRPGGACVEKTSRQRLAPIVSHPGCHLSAADGRLVNKKDNSPRFRLTLMTVSRKMEKDQCVTLM
jgi:hypothetical protein